ncbi:MAG TPA: GntR family transcriptional regulator [Solirubrobacterales bacterium]
MAHRGLTPQALSTTAPMPMTPPGTPGFLIAERFSVDHASELPVGAQLHWQLRSFIRTGQALAGERLPSVRELAERCGVNVNTVRSVYSRLEEDGLVASRQGAGTYVADDAPVSPELRELVDEALARARAAGVEPRELAVALHAVAPAPLPDVRRDSNQRGARSELRRQIARLEAELASFPRDLQPPPEPEVRPHHGGRIAGVEELERTRDSLLARVAAVREAGEKRDRRRGEARERVEEMVREPEANKWSWVSSEDTGDPGCKEWRVTPRYGPVGAAMGWWRVKVSGGCPLAT